MNQILNDSDKVVAVPFQGSEDLPPKAQKPPSPTAATKKVSTTRRVISVLLRTLTPVLIIAAAYVQFKHLKDTKPKIPQKTKAETVWPVRTAKVKITNEQPILQLYGETLPGRKVELRSLVGGKILSIGNNMREGAIVKKGETLLTIDDFSYKGALVEARARLLEAKARLDEINATIASERDSLSRSSEQLGLAQKDLARAQKLVRNKTITRKLADDRQLVVSQRKQSYGTHKNNLKIQQARAEQQKATLSRLEWGVTQAQRNLEDTRLTAPFDAYITEVGADVGRLVSANDKIATLLDKDWIDVRFTLSDRHYGTLVGGADTKGDNGAGNSEKIEGRPVKISWNVGNTPLQYEGIITRVGAKISSSSGGVEVFARIKDPHSPATIRSGAFVEVLLADRDYKNVIRLPQSAVYDNRTVYVLKDGRLKGRTVTVLGVVNNDLLIRGDLKPGERVSITQFSMAGNGVKVKELKAAQGRTP